MSPFLNLELKNGYLIFGKSVHPCPYANIKLNSH